METPSAFRPAANGPLGGTRVCPCLGQSAIGGGYDSLRSWTSGAWFSFTHIRTPDRTLGSTGEERRRQYVRTKCGPTNGLPWKGEV